MIFSYKIFCHVPVKKIQMGDKILQRWLYIDRQADGLGEEYWFYIFV